MDPHRLALLLDEPPNSPLVAALLVALAWAVWRRGVRAYSSSGN